MRLDVALPDEQSFFEKKNRHVVTAISTPRTSVNMSPQESGVLRYQRVARLEAILTIRERQQRRTQRVVLWATVVLLSVLGTAAVCGWL